MRPSRLPATALLAALTALVLVGAAIAVRPPGLPAEADGPGEAANRALADAFYEAANAAIAAGDRAPLAALVAPDFVDRGTAPDAEPDRDGLIRRLLAIRAAAPGVRLVAEDVAADGDVVIARVRVSGLTAPAFVGLRLDEEWSAWGPVDVFRVAAGRVVERRGEAADPAPPVPLLRVPLDVPPPEARTLTAARVTLAPGARFHAPGRSGPRVVYAEAGAVVVAVEGPDGDGAPPPVPLAAGEHLVLPPGAGFAAAQTGRLPAVLLDLALVAPPYGVGADSPASATSQDGVAVRIASGELWVSVAAGPTVLAVGRATLAPGERLGWGAAAGPVLLHVEAGSLDLTATGSVPWLGAADGERPNAGAAAPLAAGGGALLEPGASAEVRAAPTGPATLLVVTLVPGVGSPPIDGAAPAPGQAAGAA